MNKQDLKKLFKELYGQDPYKWNKLLEANKTKYSAQPAQNTQNKSVMTSDAFSKLLHINQHQFEDFGKKQDATINKPKSIRINNQTLAQNKLDGDKNKKAQTTIADSSAVDSFNMKDNHDGTKDVSITFKGGGKDYLYPDVPTNVANGLYAAPSKGSYVSDVISNYADYSNPKVQAKIRKGN